MPVYTTTYHQLRSELDPQNVSLIAVSKNKPVSDIHALYDLGHRDFGENYVQELLEKVEQLPTDIRWHYIGHLQTNKVKFIIPHVQLIHSVDSLKLLQEIGKQAAKAKKPIDCLLQVHIAQEETKFGLLEDEAQGILGNLKSEASTDIYKYIHIKGLMGMASFTDNKEQVREEFKHLRRIFDKCKANGFLLDTLSMGMSTDYNIAVEEGSNMVRIGSLIFGERE